MDFSNKTSLFDLVSMIIPGYTLIFSLSKILNIGELDSSGVAIVPILAASYIVGMFIHYLSKLLFDPIFKENIEQIRNAHQEVYDNIDKECMEDDDNLKCKSDKEVKRIYYERYYISIDRYKKSNIHILEAQFSFIRSMIIVLFTVFISIAYKHYISIGIFCPIFFLIIIVAYIISSFFLIVILLTFSSFGLAPPNNIENLTVIFSPIIIVFLILIMQKINKQICKSVWEDEYYTRCLDK